MIRALVAALTILGAALTIGGLLWGAGLLRKEYRRLVADLDELERISRDESLTAEQRTAQRHAVRYPTSTWGDIEYFREWIRRSILEQAVDNLGAPAVLTGAGILCSTAAGVWSLYV
ncbi:hypothetical protein ACFOSC_26550 [Streptantibioticus rubrisoli]|uniref:Uncharacterized protein n=1 Tax=Streptantibioticus rubrisoli TaxID=1387313 RepID=A0ABT1PH79_9ACTN|nr:hypothetical protein [Streptantibioticus rubrisoli]MCQ4043863.1 hypothetical protein [Streptantibioticus rubrisoli]